MCDRYTSVSDVDSTSQHSHFATRISPPQHDHEGKCNLPDFDSPLLAKHLRLSL